jgi:hypothetical protein
MVGLEQVWREKSDAVARSVPRKEHLNIRPISRHQVPSPRGKVWSVELVYRSSKAIAWVTAISESDQPQFFID